MPLIVTPGQLNRRAELYHQLGAMIAAGVPLIKALEMVTVRPALSYSRKTLLTLAQHLQSGKTFSESMTALHGWLPEFDVALLGIGEKSGRLDSSFKLLGLYYTLRAKIIHDTIMDMLITIATLHMLLLVWPIGLLIMFVQGIVNDQYTACLPFVIEKIAIFGLLYGSVFLLVYACQGRHGETWRAGVETIVQAIPVLRTAQKYLVLARLTSALDSLTNAGVSIVNAWELAANACGSPRLHRQVSPWKSEFENGATAAELVCRTDYFPAIFANLYTTGEQSGKLDETLQRLQNYFQEEGFRLLRLFTRILNGTIYGVVALIVASYIINFYVGYFNAAFNAAGF